MPQYNRLTASDPAELHQAAVDAEKSLLGSILMGQDLIINQVKLMVNRDDFHDAHYKSPPFDRHARIFEAMCRCPNPHQIAIAQELNRMGKLGTGDCAYLCDLVIWCLDYNSFIDWEEYATAVKNYSRQRQIDYANRKGDMKAIKKLTDISTTKGGIPRDSLSQA